MLHSMLYGILDEYAYGECKDIIYASNLAFCSILSAWISGLLKEFHTNHVTYPSIGPRDVIHIRTFQRGIYKTSEI